MKKIFISILFVFCLLISCGDDNPTNNSGVEKYPTKLNMEWEYNTNTVIEYYDTLGNIIDSDNLDIGNTIAKIINTKETLNSYKNLVKFECYDVQTLNNKNYDWYANSDSGLFLVAYSNAGSTQWVIPKINSSRYLTIDELFSIIKSPAPDFLTSSTSNPMDSIIYYTIPRQALAYPLTINKSWIELVYPWYRERYVEKIVTEFFQGQPVKCYIIKVNWSGYDIEINDYISLEKGLIKREILADSVIITTPANPESGGFGRISSYSNLVRISDED